MRRASGRAREVRGLGAAAAGWFVGALLVGCASAVPDRAEAQVVRGVLVESGTRRALAEGRVDLLDLEGRSVDGAVTGEDGGFVLEAPGPGDYFIRGARLGYRTTVDGVLELGAGGRLTVDFYLRPAPIRIDSVRASAEARQRDLPGGRLQALETVGFYERRDSNPGGHFLTAEEIRKVGATSADVLRSVPRVVIRQTGMFPSILMRGGRGLCTPQVWVDGAKRSRTFSTPEGTALDDLVEMRDVEAMEIYPGAATTPPRFSGIHGTCGTILVWTRHLERGVGG